MKMGDILILISLTNICLWIIFLTYICWEMNLHQIQENNLGALCNVDNTFSILYQKKIPMVNDDLLVYKSLLEAYYWIQEQKRKKNMKGKLLISFIDCVSKSLTIDTVLYFLLVELVNIRCKYLFFLVDFGYITLMVAYFYSPALRTT